MKNIVVYGVLFLLGCKSVFACNDENRFFPCDKSYIKEDQVSFNNKGISVLLSKQIIETSAIYADEGGLYFKDFKKKGDCSDGKWECQVCYYCNPNYSLYCGICWN